MSSRWLRGCVAGMLAGTCLAASAHEFECTKQVAVVPIVDEVTEVVAQESDGGGNVTVGAGLVGGLPYYGSVNVTRYPSVVFWRIDLANVADVPSVVGLWTESLRIPEGIPHAPFGIWPLPGLEVPAGVTLTFGKAARIQSYDECLRLVNGDLPTVVEGPDGIVEGNDDLVLSDRVENVFGVKFDNGFASCRARVVCVPPEDALPERSAQDAGEVTP